MHPKLEDGMSENDAQNNENHPGKKQIERYGSQPGFKQFPAFPKEISQQDVPDATNGGSDKVEEEKSSPWHFCHASQQIGGDRRKQGD